MSITKSQTEKIGSIFNGNRFQIPSYQRKYTWTEVERKALWQDIEESLNSGMNHFVGTLSFKENKTSGLSTDTHYEIIDGQQRITTLFILLSVLIDRLPDGSIKNDQRNAFIGAKDNLKLKPQGIDGDFLNRLIFDYSTIDILTVKKRSQKFMYAAKQEYIAFVTPLSIDEVEKRIIYIRDRIEILVFNVEGLSQAVKMFSIINDRGLPLRILDKTKSILMLYSTLHLSEQLNTSINDGFEQIFDSYDDLLIYRESLNILGRFDENTIFTHHYYTAERFFPETWNNRDGADTIFQNLKLRCEQLKENKNELSDFISQYVADLSVFALGYCELIKEIEINKLYQKPFQYLEFTATMYPLLVRLYLQKKLDSLLTILETTEVRVYKLRGTNPIADMYWLSSEVCRHDIPESTIRQHLINFNEKFMNNHNFRNYLDADIYQNGAVKYILSEYSSDNPGIGDYRDWQVEHIFSKEPNYNPSAYGFAEDYDYEKNRIGNLSLLESSINKGLGNQAPINKVDGYLKSRVSDIRKVGGEIQRGGFSKTSVDGRRSVIIDFCLQRFQIR